MEQAKAQLEKINEQTEYLNKIAEKDVRRPLSTIDKTRKKIVRSKIERIDLFQNQTMNRSITPNNDTTAASNYFAENDILRARNDALKRQIQQYESTKLTFSQNEKKSLNDIKPSPRVMSANANKKNSKAITRPISTINHNRNLTVQTNSRPISQTKKRVDFSFK